MSILGDLGRWLADRLFALDPRSVVAFRVALGALVVIDALDRLRDVSALYTDLGVLPRALNVTPMRPSVPFVVAGVELGWLWLVLMGIAGLALMVGWRTRMATVVAWVLMVSVHARNPQSLYGADILLRLLLFWSLLLPVSSMASVDRRAGRAPAPFTGWTAGTGAYVMQIVILYIATWWLKTGAAWHNGLAGWYTVQVDTYTGPIGIALRQWPGFLMAGTYATIWLELIGPILLLIPWRQPLLRGVVVAAFLALHLSLEVMLEIGWFPWVSCCCWLPLVPGAWWDRLGWQAAPEAEAPTSEIRGVVAVGAIFIVCWWNVATLIDGFPGVQGVFRRTALYLRLDQVWDMYAPTPLRDDGWFVVDATLRNGEHLDLITGRELSWDKPADIAHRYGSTRWNKYMRGLWGGPENRQQAYLAWSCRQHPEVVEARLVYMREDSPAPGQEADKPRRMKSSQVVCAEVR